MLTLASSNNRVTSGKQFKLRTIRPSSIMVDKKMEENIVQFCSVTGASTRDARKYLEKYKRVDVAVDAYYNNPSEFPTPGRSSAQPSTSKLHALFDKYKDAETVDITIDGTMRLCTDLGINPDDDVVMLSMALELNSPRLGQWTKQGWIDGWKSLGCDSVDGMKRVLPQLRDKVSTNPEYFRGVYSHTFDFARSEGQRSLALETAQLFWSLLLPYGLKGGALSHIAETSQDGDVSMEPEEGWKAEYLEWWFDFLKEKGLKGVSKDTWLMFLTFVRTIDSKFQKYDMEAAWPSTIDEFVDYAKARLGSS